MSGTMSGGDMPVFSEESEDCAPPDRQNNAVAGNDATTSGNGIENDTDARVLNELEVALRKTDAVLEPEVLSTLREYVRQKGNPAQAIEYLTDGYVGYAQMGSLLCSWLRFVEEEEEEADAPYARNSNNGNNNDTAPSTSHTNDRNLSKTIPDEATYLRELALEKFKPSIFSGIFSSGGSGAPKWLNSLIEDADGRNLVYDLSFRHQNCLLLTFAVQKILMQPGRDEEVASQGVDLSSYFGVFHRILMVRLRAIATTNDEEKLQKLSELVQHGAFSNVVGYLHVRQVLTHLARMPEPWSCRFKRLCEDLEMASRDGIACKMSRFFSPPDGESFAASTLIADILATASGGHIAPSSDVIKLYRQYKSRGKECVPSVKLLYHPLMIEVLLRSLFNPSKRLHGEALEAHEYILAVAVSGHDDNDDSAFETQKTFIDMKNAISTSVKMAHKAISDAFLTEEERFETEAALGHAPCCASGIVMLLRKKLSNPEYWISAYHVHKKPPFLALLMAINKKQPGMRGDVFHLVKDALQAAGNASQSLDTAISLVKVLVDLCKTAYIDKVLSWAKVWARNAASELSREFVFDILSIAEPPYSTWFATNMVKLMVVANIRRQAMGSRLWNLKAPLLKEFYDEVQRMPDLELETSENNLLRDFRVKFWGK